MDLRVLGHLRIEADGGAIAIPPGKATELQLRLLADVGQPVTVEALVDALWPTSPPRDAGRRSRSRSPSCAACSSLRWQDLQHRILAQDPGLDAPVSQARPRPLPVPLTRFIDAGGRIARTRQLFGAARLVTLTGAGGTGKTRLALETARSMSDVLVWVADLTTVQTSDGVAEAVATSLGASPATPDLLARSPGGGPLAQP